MRLRLPILVLLCALNANNAFAQIQLDRIYPPAVGIGQEAIVTAEGKFPKWPCTIVCDRDDTKVTCEDKNGQLKVTSKPGSAPGLAWVRMHDDQSASKLVPLLIEPASITAEEKDADNKLADATPLDLPAIVAGRLASGGDVDGARVVLKAGETLVASAVANQYLQSPMDAVMQIVDTDGNVLAQNDDTRGLDPQLVYQSAEDAEVVVRIFAFPSTPNSTVSFSGSKTYLYLLRLTTGPFLDHVEPIVSGAEMQTADAEGWNLPDSLTLKRQEPTTITPTVWYVDSHLGWYVQRSVDPAAKTIIETISSDQPAKADSLPVVFTGRISEAKQIDRLRFNAVAGKKYTARTYAKSHGFLLDSVLKVIDVKSGKEIVRKDDMSRTEFDAAISFTAKQDAEYELQVSDAVDAFGKRHVYGVWLGEAKPELKLTVAADHFLLEAGKTLDIPVAIERTNGYAEKLKIAAAGLPEGITAVDAFSESKGDSAKTVSLKLTAAKDLAFQGNIQIIGTEIDKDGKPTQDKFNATYQLPAQSRLQDIWLTVKNSAGA